MQNKSVLISIRPQWCELILRGEKTIEVRKSRPKLKLPFKCYIYCTYGDALIEHCDIIHPDYLAEGIKVSKNKIWDNCCNGKVIGEFVCDTIVTDKTFGHDPLFNGAACMRKVEAAAYSCQSTIYGWHISKLVIYDKPKELSEFEGLRKTKFGYEPIEIKRPPQSWQYVEEREENA